MSSQVLNVPAISMVGSEVTSQTNDEPPVHDLKAAQSQNNPAREEFPLADQSHTTPSPFSPSHTNSANLDVNHHDQNTFQQTQRAVGNLLDALRTNKEAAPPFIDEKEKNAAISTEALKSFVDGREAQPPLTSPLESASSHPAAIPPASLTFPSTNDLSHSVPLLPVNDSATTIPKPFQPLGNDVTSPTHFQSQNMPPENQTEDLLKGAVEEEELPPNVQTAQDTGQISAFAKLEFDDGPFYITTYSLELGRDARAYRAAKARLTAQKAPQHGDASASGHSRPSSMSNREGGSSSQVKGSVVSDRGGFYGVDDLEGEAQEADEERQMQQKHASQTSDHSASSIVNPKDLHTRPPLPHFNYQAYPIDEYERHIEQLPAPETAQAAVEQEEGFLLPIHHAPVKDDLEQDVANHRSVSRRHAKIFWEDDCFKLHVKGVNGAFVDEVHYPKGAIIPLREDVSIQIKGIKFQFKLPMHRSIESSEESDRVENDSPDQAADSSATSGVERSASPPVQPRAPLKVRLKNFNKLNSPPVAQPLGPDGKPKRRGPGRPPKDGVMSKRERNAKEKADREAAAKAANGGLTPEPATRGKPSRGASRHAAAHVEEPKPAKRKYTKRRPANHDADDVTPKVEDESDGLGDDAPVAKRARLNRSESPEYPKLEDLSEQELQRPPYNYSILIFDLLKESPKPLDLKGIYRGLKMKWPHFLYRYKDAKGWESSVRHNVNEDKLKIIEKVDRVGKGYSYRAKPGVDIEQHKKKRARSPPAAPKAPAPPPPRYSQQPLAPPQSAYRYPPGHPPPPPPPPPTQQGLYGHLVPTTVPPGNMAYSSAMAAPATMQSGSLSVLAGPPPHPAGLDHQTKSYPNYDVQSTAAPPAPVPPGPIDPSVSATSQASLPDPSAAFDHSSSTHSDGRELYASAAEHALPPGQQIPSACEPWPFGTSPLAPFLPAGRPVISTFESSLLDGVDNPSDVPRIQATLASVRKRVFEGAPESSLPGGETQDERTFLHYFKHILENDRFRNPGFVGWEAFRRDSEMRRSEDEKQQQQQQQQQQPQQQRNTSVESADQGLATGDGDADAQKDQADTDASGAEAVIDSEKAHDEVPRPTSQERDSTSSRGGGGGGGADDSPPGPR